MKTIGACLVTTGEGQGIRLVSVCQDINVARLSAANHSSTTGLECQIWKCTGELVQSLDKKEAA